MKRMCKPDLQKYKCTMHNYTNILMFIALHNYFKGSFQQSIRADLVKTFGIIILHN